MLYNIVMKPKLNLRGFTLIEIITSVFIMDAAIIFFQAIVNTVFFDRAAKYQDLAMRVISTEMGNVHASRLKYGFLSVVKRKSNLRLRNLRNFAII